MKIVIVTGLSGAGKSSVLNIFEDLGYYCMDNLPPQLMTNFVELAHFPNTEIDKVAIGADIRGRSFLESLTAGIDAVEEMQAEVSIIYLEASDEVLIRRYKELRRPHPMDKAGNIYDGIQREKKTLEPIREIADYVLDTSNFNLGQLKEAIDNFFLTDSDKKNFLVNVSSFGYKHGIQLDADLVFDARFIMNPYYKDELRKLTGLDKEVSDFVLHFEESKLFLNKLVDLCEFLIPLYIREGKRILVISIGCTGGRHRSVVMAEELSKRLKADGVTVLVNHRDRHHW